MQRSLLSIAFAAAVAIGAFAAPHHAQAQPACVTALFNGLVSGTCNGTARNKLMKLVIHRKNNSWVSYTEGQFTRVNSALAEATSGGGNQQFSDRVQNALPGAQNFWKPLSDRHRIRVFSDGIIEIFNFTWNFTTALVGSCSGNLITASTANEQYTISFGPPFTPFCPL